LIVRKLVVFVLGCLAVPTGALAYRPFDSTDAAVADLGEVEIELSPVSFRHEDSGPVWISPAARLNYGFAEDWEVVLEGQAEHPKEGPSTLVDNALSLKGVLQEGGLQDKSGPSVATEASILLPGIRDESGAGLALTGIVSQQWEWATLHVNLAAERSREGRAEVFFGTILEGPKDWAVRPAAEFVYSHEFGAQEEIAGLIGLIWQVSDTLAFDMGVRQASVNSRPETEVRAGLTFAFSTREN
jgi:hypothetical protein